MTDPSTRNDSLIGLTVEGVVVGYYDGCGRLVVQLTDPELDARARAQGREFIIHKMKSKLRLPQDA